MSKLQTGIRDADAMSGVAKKGTREVRPRNVIGPREPRDFVTCPACAYSYSQGDVDLSTLECPMRHCTWVWDPEELEKAVWGVRRASKGT